jgi:hypothetical protein
MSDKAAAGMNPAAKATLVQVRKSRRRISRRQPYGPGSELV